MSSGIEWKEGYEGSPFDSHVVTALYRTKSAKDFGLYRAKITKKIAPPGERFNYSSGDTNLLMRSMKKALGTSYEDYPWDRLFTPIGMTSAVMERDPSRTFIGSSYFLATARDFARFGYLFLREGRWKGKQILPLEWVKLASTPSPAMSHLRMDHDPENSPYGHSWWLNRPFPQAQIGKPYPDFPDDLYFAAGHDGQQILVIPSWDALLVRLGNDRGEKKIDLAKMGSLLKAARK
jgi:CubicO group peptidase (beta-lactamase class C family)